MFINIIENERFRRLVKMSKKKKRNDKNWNGVYRLIPDDVVKSPYFNLLSILMGEVGAGEYDYLELQN